MIPTIMVIDDEPLIGQLLRYQLGDAGYAVTSYQSAHEALNQMAHTQPDLVLLDVMMPGISGYDLCREIRSFSQVPVIMLTAKHADEDMVAGLSIGADDYVSKPFSTPHLLARIESVLRRSGPTSTQKPTRSWPSPPPTLQARPIQQALVSASHPPTLPRLGSKFNAARHDHSLTLHEASMACGVRWEFLQAIEQEQFSYIPHTELRAALHSYSTLLGIDMSPYQRPQARRKSRQESIVLVAALTLLTVLVIALLL
ncbi:MAG: response regulator [Oscillochloris sp.]|nr:response regulator [Oscillochloris sp.]